MSMIKEQLSPKPPEWPKMRLIREADEKNFGSESISIKTKIITFMRKLLCLKK